jgi:hypothetical protein
LEYDSAAPLAMPFIEAASDFYIMVQWSQAAIDAAQNAGATTTTKDKPNGCSVEGIEFNMSFVTSIDGGAENYDDFSIFMVISEECNACDSATFKNVGQRDPADESIRINATSYDQQAREIMMVAVDVEPSGACPYETTVVLFRGTD